LAKNEAVGSEKNRQTVYHPLIEAVLAIKNQALRKSKRAERPNLPGFLFSPLGLLWLGIALFPYINKDYFDQ
jgi:hypothetical protein